MTITHKITNKKNPESFLRGHLLPFDDHTDGFEFYIDGSAIRNIFGYDQWDIEEVKPPFSDHPMGTILDSTKYIGERFVKVRSNQWALLSIQPSPLQGKVYTYADKEVETWTHVVR